MKIFTKSTILALILSNSFLFVAGQTLEQRQKIAGSYDQRKLNELKDQYSLEFTKNYEKALELAKINNWPLRIYKEDGRYSVLMGVTENYTPLYYITDNAGSAKTSRANTLYPGGALGLSLTGSGMYAGVWDQGLPRSTHLDLAPRIINYDNSDTPYMDHGTHVAGTVISSGTNSGSGLPGRGIAYQASVLSSDWSNDLSEMAGAAATEGLLLSNHSYGLDSSASGFQEYYYGAYIATSKQLDDVVFNAPYYQPVVSAGNDRDSDTSHNAEKLGYDLMKKYACSKNAIVVAAVLQVNNYTGPNSVAMSSFSNWGPTDDNRIKPDISDKGVNVYSTISTSDIAYQNQNGTSMASPGVTGTLLLLQQHYSNIYSNLDIPYMKNATLRALLCHTADEAGSFDGPDPKFGWGLINAQRAAQTITKSVDNQSSISELTLNQGGAYTKNVTVVSGEPLVVTVAWTDLGGKVSTGVIDDPTPVLVNDLDVRVTKVGGEINYPWKLNDVAGSASVKGDNSVDNIEKVEVPGAAGDYTITVTHKGALAGNKQDFSLIVTGTGLNLGTAENDFEVFNIWPNPANDVLNISLRSDSGEDTFVTLYDVQGKRVLSQKLEEINGYIEGSLNINGINEGLYMVNINQGAKQSTKKVVIRK